VIVGPSGAGKGSIVNGLSAREPRLWLSRSWTTRPPRPGEPPDAYTFVDREAFLAHADAGGFVESAEVFGHLYGTPTPDAPPGNDLLLEIDVQGAAQVRARRPDAVVILVAPPSREAQEARLRARGDDEALIRRRLAKADAEEEAGRLLADHVVVNDDLNRAIEEAAAIVESHRSAGRPPT
jgi:guanylate kinase